MWPFNSVQYTRCFQSLSSFPNLSQQSTKSNSRFAKRGGLVNNGSAFAGCNLPRFEYQNGKCMSAPCVSRWANTGKTECPYLYFIKLPALAISELSTRSLRRRPYFRLLCTSLLVGRDTAVESVPSCRP